MSVFVGIDPGVTGAIAMIAPGPRLQVWDIPTLEVRTGRKNRHVMDLGATIQILRSLRPLNPLVLLEDPVIMTARKSARVKGLSQAAGATGEEESSIPYNATTMARGWQLHGQLQGILVTLGMRYEPVNPQTWKPLLLPGQTREKDASRQKAMQLWPASLELFARKKDHNRAEAALLGEWGRRTNGG